MPIIKSAIKKMRQDVKKTERNNTVRNRLKSRIKELMKAVHDHKTAELPEMLKKTTSIIDIALKKKIIKKNNAAHKKSRMARLVKHAMTAPKAKKETAPEAAVAA